MLLFSLQFRIQFKRKTKSWNGISKYKISSLFLGLFFSGIPRFFLWIISAVVLGQPFSTWHYKLNLHKRSLLEQVTSISNICSFAVLAVLFFKHSLEFSYSWSRIYRLNPPKRDCWPFPCDHIFRFAVLGLPLSKAFRVSFLPSFSSYDLSMA